MRHAWRTGCGVGGTSPRTRLWQPRTTPVEVGDPRLKECRNDQWSTSLQSLDPVDQSLWRKTKRVVSSCSIPPGHPKGIVLSDWESRSPCRRSGDSDSTGDRSFASGSYWDVWRGAEVSLPDPWQWTKLNKSWLVSLRHQGSLGQQGSGHERNQEHGFKESSPASCFTHAPEFQCDSSHLSLSYSLVARSCNLYPYIDDGSGTSLILSAHYSLRKDW